MLAIGLRRSKVTKSSGLLGQTHVDKFGEYHNTKGPAVIFDNGTQMWFLRGRVHREDGPAVIHKDGKIAYYLNDQFITSDPFIWFAMGRTDNR